MIRLRCELVPFSLDKLTLKVVFFFIKVDRENPINQLYKTTF